jgi:hypothetical protein
MMTISAIVAVVPFSLAQPTGSMACMGARALVGVKNPERLTCRGLALDKIQPRQPFAEAPPARSPERATTRYPGRLAPLTS